jgi:hypothetical protein
VGTFLVACSLISSGAGIAYHAVEGVRAAAPSDPKVRERRTDHPQQQQQVLSGEERLVPTELALYGAIGSILVKEVRTITTDDDDELRRERGQSAHTAHAGAVVHHRFCIR